MKITDFVLQKLEDAEDFESLNHKSCIIEGNYFCYNKTGWGKMPPTCCQL